MILQPRDDTAGFTIFKLGEDPSRIWLRKRGRSWKLISKNSLNAFQKIFLERLKGEIEEMSMQMESGGESNSSSESRSSFFDQAEDDNSDTDVDTIVKGLKVEDY